MALGFVQGEMNTFAARMLELLPEESITYTGATDTGTKTGHFADFTKQELAFDPMLQEERQFKCATTALTAPARRDTLTRADGSLWEVTRVTGGPGRPFWFLNVRQVT